MIVDADYYIYQAGRLYEDVVYWGEDLLTTTVQITEAKRFIDNALQTLQEAVGASKVTITLSCSTEDNYRTNLWPNYKKDRIIKTRPAGYKALRNHLLEKHNALVEPQLEADDLCGIIATTPSEYRCITVSVDKDFDTLPVPRVNQDKLGNGIHTPTPEEADYFFFSQILMGDKADGFPGCPGFGPVSAKKLLDKTPREEWWDTIVAAFEKKKLTEEDALMNARMAFILRDGYYDWDTKKIRIWNND